MMHAFADFLKGIFSHAGTDLRRDIQHKIPKRPAVENLPQVDRNQHLDGTAALDARHLFRLNLDNRLHHNRA